MVGFSLHNICLFIWNWHDYGLNMDYRWESRNVAISCVVFVVVEFLFIPLVVVVSHTHIPSNWIDRWRRRIWEEEKKNPKDLLFRSKNREKEKKSAILFTASNRTRMVRSFLLSTQQFCRNEKTQSCGTAKQSAEKQCETRKKSNLKFCTHHFFCGARLPEIDLRTVATSTTHKEVQF